MKLALGVICAVLGVEIALMLLTWVIQVERDMSFTPKLVKEI